jgi:hypothetical protein
VNLGVAADGEAVTPELLAARARTWWSEEPALLRREREAMARTAPDLVWSGNGAGSWTGLVPAWPFDRSAPAGLEAFMTGRRLRVQLAYGHAFPMTPPAVWPLDPQPSIEQRTQHAWHVNGDGSLCLLEDMAAWTGRDPAAELIVKAAGWFIEYLLMSAGLITRMTSTGLNGDVSLDGVISGVGATVRPEASLADGGYAGPSGTPQ